MRNKKDEFYRTPKWVTHRLLDIMPWVKYYVDPCCGDGRILSAISEHDRGAMAQLFGFDLEVRGDIQSTCEFKQISVFDLPQQKQGTAIITNPPAAIAQEVIEHCFSVPELRYAAFLLPLTFLGGRDSSPAFRVSSMPLVAILPDRFSFTGYGVESIEYAWFVWGVLPGIRFLDRTPLGIRRRETTELRKLFNVDNGGPSKRAPKNPKGYGQFNPNAVRG